MNFLGILMPKRVFVLVLATFIALFAASSGRAEIQENCVYSAKIKNATLQNCMGQNVITLEGTPAEMAIAHGKIFKKHFSADVSKYFSNKVDDTVAFLPSFFKVIAQYVLSKLSSKLHQNMPDSYLEELETYSRHSGISAEQLHKALAAPDLASLGYSYLNSSFRMPLFGCTSVGLVQDGDLFFGRNLDFEGTDLLDKHSLIVVHKPTSGSELKRAAFVADGIHFSGISAFNEAGVAVFVHQNFSSERSLQGLPILLLTDWMLKVSHNMDEAIRFLKEHRPGPMWTLVLVDTRQKKIKSVEISNTVLGIRESASVAHVNSERAEFVQTNHLLTPEARKTQWISYPLLRNSIQRYSKASKSLSEIKGNPSIDSLREVLGYQKTLSNFEPSLHEDIAKPSTVHTVFIEAKKNQEPIIWLSRSLAPSSLGGFIKIKMKDFFASTDHLTKFEFVDQDPRTVTTYDQQRILVQAFKAAEDEHDLKKALHLTESFHSPSVLLFRASLYYNLNQWDDVRSFLKDFSSNQNQNRIPQFLQESAVGLVVLSLYHQEKYDEAKKLAANFLKKYKWEQHHWYTILSKISLGQELNSNELEVLFDSFSGALDTPPEHLMTLSDDSEK
ncbi:MAG: C45 family autoproteolytic acyltransferase/hydrolase [Bdellovibrio sp.]